MFITVTCPKCGRSIKAKKKFVLSTGGIPCLKCKVRIPVTHEQVDALAEKEAADAVRESVADAVASPEETSVPEPVAEAADDAAPEPVSVAPSTPPPPLPPPVLEPALPSAPELPAGLAIDESADAVTPVIAQPVSDSVSATQEIASDTISGPQIVFTCSHCLTTYPLRQSLTGKKIRCKGCSRIVKVAADSPVIPGTDPSAPPPPVEDDIPVVFSPGEATAPPPPSPPAPAPVVFHAPPADSGLAPDGGGAPEIIRQLRQSLAEAEERANTAEETLQQQLRDKAMLDMASVRKSRELDAQIRDLTAKLKAREEELRNAASGGMKKTEIESLLKNLCEALDANLQQELRAHQSLVEDLKKQLLQALR